MSLRSFIRRALGRETPQFDLSPPGARATDEWRSGDLGECIGNGPWFFMGGIAVDGPQKGDLVRVTGVSVVCGFDALAIEGRQNWWQASRFRKLHPEQSSGSRSAWRDLLKTVRPKAPVGEKING
jgi:hypothetical protein